jgi:hypothetical protein
LLFDLGLLAEELKKMTALGEGLPTSPVKGLLTALVAKNHRLITADF